MIKLLLSAVSVSFHSVGFNKQATQPTSVSEEEEHSLIRDLQKETKQEDVSLLGWVFL